MIMMFYLCDSQSHAENNGGLKGEERSFIINHFTHFVFVESRYENEMEATPRILRGHKRHMHIGGTDTQHGLLG